MMSLFTHLVYTHVNAMGSKFVVISNDFPLPNNLKMDNQHVIRVFTDAQLIHAGE